MALRRALLAGPEESLRRTRGELPMPSPWAAGMALLALLGFGVFVGSILGGSSQSAPTQVLLAERSAPAGSAPKPPAVPVSTSTPNAESAETPEAEPEAQTTAAATTITTTSSSKQATGKHQEKKQSETGSGEPATPGSQLPPVQHVFLIVLSDQGESAAFGSGSQAPYLAKTLRAQGELIDGYYAVSNGELANGIALISGQGPTPQTAADCPSFVDLAPGSAGKLGQALGSGCVYPSSTHTLANQLTDSGKTWKAYVEGMGSGEAAGAGTAGAGGGGEAAGAGTAGASQAATPTCEHPAIGAAAGSHATTGTAGGPGSTGTADGGAAGSTGVPGSTGGYASWRNPFVYFHSLIDSKACAEDDVGLGQLAGDLKNASATPSFAYIVPSLCDDGSAQPCAPGKSAGLAAAEGFLRQVVPEIERSAAYKQGGLIAITFDQAPQSGPQADSSGCCLSSAFPNMPAGSQTNTSAPPGAPPSPTSTAGSTPQAPAAATSGGGKVGLLLISKYVKPASFNATGQYNHFSLLHSIEELLGLQPLGYAAEPGLLAFDSSVFNAWHG